MRTPAKSVRLTFKRDEIDNLIRVLDWGLSGLDDEKKTLELEALVAKLIKAEAKFYDN